MPEKSGFYFLFKVKIEGKIGQKFNLDIIIFVLYT